MASKYKDVNATIQVIGSVLTQPSLLDFTDRYTLTDEDFDDEFHRVVFGAIYKIHELGARIITIDNIVDFLSTRPKYDIIFKANKGVEWLNEILTIAQPLSFDYYYSRLKKMSLLRAYDKYGIDVSFIYDIDNIFDMGKRQAQEDYLDNATLEDIAKRIDDRIEEIKYQYVNEVDGSVHQAGDEIIELIESLKETPEVGSPMYGNLINTVTKGARLRKFYLRSAPTGIGKRIADNTPIPTPNGWRTVGDIAVGDYIFGKDGNSTKVIATYKNIEKIWRLKLTDGRTIDCCKEHLWEYYCNGEKFISDTQTIHQLMKNNKVYLPINEPVQYNIPDTTNILFSSIEQRLLTLVGLINLNGVVAADKRTIDLYFRSTEDIEMINELCHSLGMITFVSNDIINISCRNDMKNKLKSLSPYLYALQLDTTDKINDFINIVSIEPIDEEVPMTCFTVDSADALFQVGDFVVTHNTRSMIADACFLACDKIYDDTYGWINNGIKEPVFYITTEQDKNEIQTMMLAFLSNVNEDHILNGKYDEGEEDRVIYAARLLKSSPLYIRELPDFSLQDVENEIKKAIRDYETKYVCLDYIHVSMKILEEITKRSGGIKLREDNVLFMLSNKLKDICNKEGVFILSATQLNGSYVDSEVPDQNLLRGAKSIADKIDTGMILLPVKDKDITSLDSILKTHIASSVPNIKLSVYKNRRGKYKGVYLWCKADLGTCRINPMFCTTYNYELVKIDDTKINVEEDK